MTHLPAPIAADDPRWGQFWPNFTFDEMACRCGCNTCRMDPAVLDKLQHLRDLLGRPLPVSSGYRCANHSAEIKKSRPGQHFYGRAVDITVSHDDAGDLVALAWQAGWSVGVNQKGAGRFIHLDRRADFGLPRVFYSY